MILVYGNTTFFILTLFASYDLAKPFLFLSKEWKGGNVSRLVNSYLWNLIQHLDIFHTSALPFSSCWLWPQIYFVIVIKWLQNFKHLILIQRHNSKPRWENLFFWCLFIRVLPNTLFLRFIHQNFITSPF